MEKSMNTAGSNPFFRTSNGGYQPGWQAHGQGANPVKVENTPMYAETVSHFSPSIQPRKVDSNVIFDFRETVL